MSAFVSVASTVRIFNYALKKIFAYSLLLLITGGTLLYCWPHTTAQAVASPARQQAELQPTLTPPQQIIAQLQAKHNQLTSPYQQLGLSLTISDLKNEQLPVATKLAKLNHLLDGQLITFTESERQALTELMEQWQAEQPTPQPAPAPVPDYPAQILSYLSNWQKTASKSTKRAIKATLKTWHSSASWTDQLNDLDHLLTHYGPAQTQLQTLFSQWQAQLHTKLAQWKNIHSFFTLDLIQAWENHGFTWAQTKEWIDVGLKVEDYHYAYWLTKVVELDPLTVLNEGYDPDLREQYQEWLANHPNHA